MARRHVKAFSTGFRLKDWMDTMRAQGAKNLKTINYPDGSVTVSWSGKAAPK